MTEFHAQGVWWGGGFGFVLMLLFWALMVLAFWKIFEKAGFSGAWGLLALLPMVQPLLLLFLAFADWPARRKTIEG
jgi:hypothetical protein